jgi:hypothetical protein
VTQFFADPGIRAQEKETKKRVGTRSPQGCQIFLGTKYQNAKNIPNYQELYQMPIKYNKRP